MNSRSHTTGSRRPADTAAVREEVAAAAAQRRPTAAGNGRQVLLAITGTTLLLPAAGCCRRGGCCCGWWRESLLLAFSARSHRTAAAESVAARKVTRQAAAACCAADGPPRAGFAPSRRGGCPRALTARVPLQRQPKCKPRGSRPRVTHKWSAAPTALAPRAGPGPGRPSRGRGRRVCWKSPLSYFGPFPISQRPRLPPHDALCAVSATFDEFDVAPASSAGHLSR